MTKEREAEIRQWNQVAGNMTTRELLAELDATRERVAKLEAALIHAERNLGLICRCAPGYQCALCHVREALKEAIQP